MNNKQRGNRFEKKMCEILSRDGWWVHFISPDARGSQPFDIIAVRDGVPAAIDCKTCESHIFRLSRLEDNQVNAFAKWLACGNDLAYLAVLYNDNVYMIYYKNLCRNGSVDLHKMDARYRDVSL